MRKFISILTLFVFIFTCNLSTYAAPINDTKNNSPEYLFVKDMLENPNVTYSVYNQDNVNITHTFNEEIAHMTIEEICIYAKENSYVIETTNKRPERTVRGPESGRVWHTNHHLMNLAGTKSIECQFFLNWSLVWSEDYGIERASCNISEIIISTTCEHYIEATPRTIISANRRTVIFSGDIIITEYSEGGQDTYLYYDHREKVWSC